jgi:hypothetical protein
MKTKPACSTKIRSRKKIIHINKHKIASNLKHGTNEPVITVKTSKSNTYGHLVEIQGPSQIIHSPNKPLSCGARVWISTIAPVIVDGKVID